MAGWQQFELYDCLNSQKGFQLVRLVQRTLFRSSDVKPSPLDAGLVSSQARKIPFGSRCTSGRDLEARSGDPVRQTTPSQHSDSLTRFVVGECERHG